MWNIYLVNRGEPLLCYISNLSDADVAFWAGRALLKALDGSDADGFLVMPNYCSIPKKWTGNRG